MSSNAIAPGHRSIATALLLGTLLVSGCDDRADPAEPDVDPTVTAEIEAAHLAADVPAAGAPAALNREIAALRAATARFHRISQAEDAEYIVLVRHPETDVACFEHPELGGMGRHFLNPSLVDEVVSALEPEVVIYEPGPNGKLRLVAFEYVIPFAVRGQDADPPMLFGQEFVQNETFKLWVLHVWAWKHNPSGMFADWNPTVTCEFDDQVED